ncbi:MAG: AraC family ligand binding domain-containing protein, partial [Planctomycetota bacterium]|nr:AraC family ligand binding domain-containing protein [Planctomycetota bacterium]
MTLRGILAGMAAARLVTPVNPFPESLWPKERGLPPRSRQLTPLYAYRYAGCHGAEHATVHDFWELIYVFRGRGKLLTAVPLKLLPGMAYLIPPRLPHRENSARPLDVLWIGLRGEALAECEACRVSSAYVRHLEPLFEFVWLSAERMHEAVGPELDALALACLLYTSP